MGDTIEVHMELDTEPRSVKAPPDLARVLAKDGKAAAAWAKLSFTNKKEIAASLVDAKKPDTRKPRLDAAIAKLSAKG